MFLNMMWGHFTSNRSEVNLTNINIILTAHLETVVTVLVLYAGDVCEVSTF